MPETTTPPAPPTQETTLSNLPRSGRATTVPSEMISAINAASTKNGGSTVAVPEPPQDPSPPVKTPPEPKEKQPEAIKTAPSPTEPAKPAALAPSSPPTDEPKGVRQVREALERATKRAEDLQASLTATTKEKADALQKQAELEAKHQKMTEEIEKDYKPRVERLKAVEEKLQQREQILKIKAYQDTDEFHEKFVAPLSAAQQEARELLSELVINGDDGSSRPATQDDFNEVLAAPSLNQAADIAQRKFGPLAAQSVVNLRHRIRTLERNRQDGIKNSALAAEEHEKRMIAQEAEYRQRRQQFFVAKVQELMEAEPEVFKPAEEDQEAIATLTEAAQFADRLMNKPPDMTEEQFLSEVAKGRTRIMKSFVQDKKLKRLTEENVTLKEKLKAYENSEPTVETRNGGPAPRTGSGDPIKDQMLKDFQAIANKRR